MWSYIYKPLYPKKHHNLYKFAFRDNAAEFVDRRWAKHVLWQEVADEQPPKSFKKTNGASFMVLRMVIGMEWLGSQPLFDNKGYRWIYAGMHRFGDLGGCLKIGDAIKLTAIQQWGKSWQRIQIGGSFFLHNIALQDMILRCVALASKIPQNNICHFCRAVKSLHHRWITARFPSRFHTFSRPKDARCMAKLLACSHAAAVWHPLGHQSPGTRRAWLAIGQARRGRVRYHGHLKLGGESGHCFHSLPPEQMGSILDKLIYTSLTCWGHMEC